MANVTPEMEQAKARAEERLLAVPGVTGVDIGFKEVGGEPTDQLAIRVLVSEKKPIDDVPEDERIPDEIEGHPSDVIQRRFELHSTGAYLAADAVLPPVDTGSYYPLRGGVSCGPSRAVGGFVHAGTLGAIVVDNASRRQCALSNYHVLAVDADAADGDAIVQPSMVDGGESPAQVAGWLRRHVLTDTVDAAVMDLSNARGVRPEVAEIGALTGTGTASLGQAVHKRGRTTRLTHGVVDSVNLTLNVDYGHGIGVKTLTGQIGVRPDPARSARFTAKGDSGAVLVGDAREVIGLLFAGDEAGYGVANPIADVLAALDVDIATATAAKRVELTAKKQESGDAKFAEFKERFGGKERKSDKTEFKDDKDQKNEDKEIKDLKNEDKENKDGKDSKDDKDKEGKDESKESKDKTEKEAKGEFKDESKDEAKENKDKEFKNERKEFKESKDKEEKDESKERKDEGKEFKDDKEFQEKREKGEPKEGKDEFKDDKDKEMDKSIKDEKDHKDFQFEVVSQSVPSPLEQRIAALEAAISRLTAAAAGGQETRGGQDEGAQRKDPKAEKFENKEKFEKREGKEKDEFKEKFEQKEKPEKWENKEKPENKEKLENKELKFEKPAKEFEGPGPVDQRLVSLETRVAQLSHFILRSLRPDLSKGALHREPDAETLRQEADEAKPEKDDSDTPPQGNR